MPLVPLVSVIVATTLDRESAPACRPTNGKAGWKMFCYSKNHLRSVAILHTWGWIRRLLRVAELPPVTSIAFVAMRAHGPDSPATWLRPVKIEGVCSTLQVGHH